MLAGAGRVYFDRVQRLVWRVLVGVGCGLFFGCLLAVVANGACRILRGGLHRVSLWTVRRARPVANAAAASAFDRSSIALWIGGAGARSGDDRWFGTRPGICDSHTAH